MFNSLWARLYLQKDYMIEKVDVNIYISLILLKLMIMILKKKGIAYSRKDF